MRDIPFIKINQKLENYVQRGMGYPVAKQPAFSDTIAVVAFVPRKGNGNKFQEKKARDLTVRLLAATVESLRRAGFGRTVVVGMDNAEDSQLVEEAFKMIYSNIRDRSKLAMEGMPNKIGHMEVGFVQRSSEHAKTQAQDKNVPKAALQGLREAFQNNDKAWLGTHNVDDWKYVYLTEADNVLSTRPSSLPVLKQQVEMGRVLIPHGLQPIPHQSDVSGTREGYLFVSGRGNPVMELNALDRYPGICCDEHKGPDHKPGLAPNHPECQSGKPWYSCDLDPKMTKRTHNRLQQYSLIRLTQGTQMVMLSAQESGRGCLPPKKKWNTKICSAPKS